MIKQRALRSRILLPITTLLAALWLSGCATNPVTGKQEVVLMSEKQELALGRQYHQHILKQYKLYDNPELQAYVEEIGERLARQSHRPDLVFHFYLLDSPEVNAFALPGGYIYITRGILSYMQREEHLAGVVGHEIGHVTARHGVRRHRNQTLAGIGGIGVAIATGSRELAQATNMLGSALISGYGRDNELESDRLGAEYLAKSGYEPEQMIDVIGILKDQELFDKERAKAENRPPRAYHGVFASHPRNDRRLQEVIRAANQYKVSQPLSVDNRRFMQLQRNMTYGPSEDQGVIRGNAFMHKALNFYTEFPDGWIIDNLPDRVVAREPSGKRAVILQMRDLNKRVPARQFLQSNFQSFDSGREVSTSEDQAYAGRAVLNTRNGARPALVAAVYRGKRAFMLYGLGDNQLPEQDFLAVVESLRKLKGNERKLASAQKIQITKAKPGDTVAKLAKKTTLGKYAEQQLRLLNGWYPDGEPEPGQLIKLVR